jgi:hypothetical protein
MTWFCPVTRVQLYSLFLHDSGSNSLTATAQAIEASSRRPATFRSVWVFLPAFKFQHLYLDQKILHCTFKSYILSSSAENIGKVAVNNDLEAKDLRGHSGNPAPLTEKVVIMSITQEWFYQSYQ